MVGFDDIITALAVWSLVALHVVTATMRVAFASVIVFVATSQVFVAQLYPH